MKVYTKTGDKGETSLVGGTRVRKDDPRVNSYGNVDELISYIALIRAETTDKPYYSNLRRIQACLMLVAAHLAADSKGSERLKNLEYTEIEFLEQQIDDMTSKLPPQTAFILPQGPKEAAYCHIARTVCRRAERSCISVISEPRLEYPIKYLNRLSDYLFVYGRYLAMDAGIGDDFWIQ